jgi:hypothetical protein
MKYVVSKMGKYPQRRRNNYSKTPRNLQLLFADVANLDEGPIIATLTVQKSVIRLVVVQSNILTRPRVDWYFLKVLAVNSASKYFRRNKIFGNVSTLK